MKKFSLPKTVWSILGDVAVQPLDSEKTDRLGEFDGELRTIQIKESLHDDVKLAVFWHEIVHLALYDSGVTNILRSRIKGNKKEEAICDAISAYLTGLTRAGQLTLGSAGKR